MPFCTHIPVSHSGPRVALLLAIIQKPALPSMTLQIAMIISSSVGVNRGGNNWGPRRGFGARSGCGIELPHMTFKEVRKQNLRLDLGRKRDNCGEALADAATAQESHLLDLRGSLLPGTAGSHAGSVSHKDLMGLEIVKSGRGWE